MGTQGGLTPNASTSSSQSVATTNNAGLGNALSVGTATVTATVNNVFTDQACSQPHSISSGASLTVVKIDLKHGNGHIQR